MTEKRKHTLDKDKKVGALFMDLSKAFDTLNQILLLAKLNTYDFSFNAIKFVQSYLLEQFQRGSGISSYKIELRNRVTQNNVTLRVTNSKSKNKKLHFELLTQSRKMKSYTSSY